ncbi:hypothetical protein L916_12407 [Phytophthora nicotianae]|uniref:Uncharacterized protein n=1 Tax=Phytophthora nicotianae TaxID=4792 RepID=W2IN09_PHYNI|nr:hypothetical protein L916_12407 [Phytophthora nicotianae]
MAARTWCFLSKAIKCAMECGNLDVLKWFHDKIPEP